MVILWIIVTIAVIVITVSAAWAGWRAAPFVPTFSKDVARMIDLAELKPGERIVDIGAGDGRILLAALNQQPDLTAVGYEVSVGMWLVAQLRIWLSRKSKRATVLCQDFFVKDLSSFDVVFCFLTPKVMAKLGTKLQQELKPGARVISAVFPIPNWPLDMKDKPTKRVSVYRYCKQ